MGLHPLRHQDCRRGNYVVLPSSANSISDKIVGNTRVECLCRFDIAVAGGSASTSQFGYTASIKRGRLFRVKLQSGIIIVDCGGVSRQLQLDQSATVEGVDILRPNLQGLVTVL